MYSTVEQRCESRLKRASARYKDAPLGPKIIDLHIRLIELELKSGANFKLLPNRVELNGGLMIFKLGVLALTSMIVIALRKLPSAVPSLLRSRFDFISEMPGARLLQLAQLFFSPATVERTFNPIVSDWRTEYFEAHKEGRVMRAQLISACYTHKFVAAMVLSKAYSFLRIFTSAG
jgi:hypothetical protein